MDDIHIEGRNPTQIQEFKNEVHKKIKQVKNENFIPVVICAGDIGEGITGIEWAKDYDCDVIYTCGNHEFWNRDFFETYKNIEEELKKPEYKNIHFINNNSIVLHDIRFIGGTMWTNVGNFLNWYDNKNLSIKYFPVMGDFRKITIKGWYSEENINLLKDFVLKNASQMTPIIEENLKSLIENEFFNPLFELQEHTKTINYIREELKNKFDGTTIVVTHHLPEFNLWAKAKKMNMKVLQGEYLNNDRLLLEGAKGNNKMYRDAMLIGYYSNDLRELMFGELAPDYWVHGHLHIPVQAIIGNTKIISSPVGYNSQSTEMKMKEFIIGNNNTFIAEAIRNNIEEYSWEDSIVKTLSDYEIAIKTFTPLVQSNFVVAGEFKVIMNQFKIMHQNNVDELKKEITKWLSPIIFNTNKNIADKDLDYFNVVLKSGVLNSKIKAVNGEELKYKLPDYITADVGPFSFKEDLNGNETKNLHYKYWKTEIQKIIIQIKNLRKLLLEFANDLEKKDQ